MCRLITSKIQPIELDTTRLTLANILICLSQESTSFENIAWSTMFLLAPFGCIYYPVETLPEIFQIIAYILPLVYIFEETRNILVNQVVDYQNILQAFYLNIFYLLIAIYVFYYSFNKARDKGTLINIGE